MEFIFEGKIYITTPFLNIVLRKSETDGKWVTIAGNHVFISKGGKIIKGPKKLVGIVLNGNKHSPRLKRNLAKVEALIRDKKYEIGYAFNKNGEIIWKKSGNVNSIKADETLRKGYLKNSVFTHNHPNGSSFSVIDIMSLLRYHISEIRAVGSGYTYIMKLPEGFSYSFKSLRKIVQEINKAGKKVEEEINRDELDSSLGLDVPDKDYNHILWTIMAEKSGLKYERIKQ